LGDLLSTALEYLSMKTLHQYQRRRSARSCSPSLRVDLGSQRGQDGNDAESRKPFLGEDSEAVGADEFGDLKRSFDGGRGSPPVGLEVGRRQVDEDPRLRVKTTEQGEGAKHENTELVLVGLALRPRPQTRVSSAGGLPQVVQANP
jgi:hypothetical protein